MRQLIVFVQKEFYHIIRDPRTMLILLAMPIVQIILFGFAISTEMKSARIVIVDPSKDIATQRTIERFSHSEYFSVVATDDTPKDVERLFRENRIDAALIFDNKFATNGQVQVIADATDPNTATIIAEYATFIIQEESQQAVPIQITTSLLYNPSMKSAYNFVPGVMGLILMLICAMMTSIAIVREKENGTMEVLLVSPIHPIAIIMAKVVPYLTLSAVNLTTILLLAVFVLEVPISGSLFWLLLLSLVFIFVALALGILISTLVKTQVAAMIISGMVLMMPTVLLSGMMFPIENMPPPLQIFSSLIPARWYVAGVRKLMIQGVEVQFVWKEFVVLISMATVLMAVSLKKFKIRL